MRFFMVLLVLTSLACHHDKHEHDTSQDTGVIESEPVSPELVSPQPCDGEKRPIWPDKDEITTDDTIQICLPNLYKAFAIEYKGQLRFLDSPKHFDVRLVPSKPGFITVQYSVINWVGQKSVFQEKNYFVRESKSKESKTRELANESLSLGVCKEKKGFSIHPDKSAFKLGEEIHICLRTQAPDSITRIAHTAKFRFLESASDNLRILAIEEGSGYIKLRQTMQDSMGDPIVELKRDFVIQP